MSELSQILGNHGAPFELHDGDKVYHAKLIDGEVEDAFSKKLFAKAIDAAMMMKRTMTPEKYQAHLKTLNDDFVAGEYDLKSQRGLKSIGTTWGTFTLCCLLFDVQGKQMMDLMIRKKDEVVSLFGLIIKESLPSAVPSKNGKPKEGEEENQAVPTSPAPA